MFETIEWIFFDVGSMIVDESMAYQHRIEDTIKGTDITYQMFYDTMIQYYKQNKKGDIETIKQYGLVKPKWHAEDERLYPEVKECFNLLRSNYKIGIIANQSFGTKDRLQAFGVFKYIDLIIASAEEGVSKPDLRIFELALKRAECMPENAVMIGDRLDNDIAPAKTLGMKTIWIKQGFSGKYSIPRTDMEQADYIVNNLNEVRELFLASKSSRKI